MSEDEKPVCGPICNECKKSRNTLVPIFVKHEHQGRFEMVKIYLCLYHFFQLMENDSEEPPVERDDEQELPPDNDGFEEWEEENPDGDGDDEDDQGRGFG
jgi:hypothetical protein